MHIQKQLHFIREYVKDIVIALFWPLWRHAYVQQLRCHFGSKSPIAIEPKILLFCFVLAFRSATKRKQTIRLTSYNTGSDSIKSFEISSTTRNLLREGQLIPDAVFAIVT